MELHNLNWKQANIGDQVICHISDFDGGLSLAGNVTEKYQDHIIIDVEGMSLWIDDLSGTRLTLL